ncbi:MAG: hypothetical protein ACXWP4_17995 [Polyangiales bacterium]
MRHDLYGPIHKGLRHCMQAALVRFGQADVDERDDLLGALDDLRAMFSLRANHLELEEQIVHPALDARVPGWLMGALGHEHEEQRQVLYRLAERARGLGRRALDRRFMRNEHRALYLALASALADDLEHMEVEETLVNPLLWEAFDDAELRALQRTLMECSSPDQLAAHVHWVVPAVSHSERVELMETAREGIGVAAYARLLGLARTVLTPREYDRLCAALPDSAR